MMDDDNNDNDNSNSHDVVVSNNTINSNSTNLFVPLNTIGTLKRSISLYLQSGTVRTFIKLALFFVIPATAILLTVVYYVMNQINNQNNNNDNSDNFTNLFWKYVTILMSQSLLQTTLGAIAEGAIAVAVAELYLHRHPSWYICLQKASTKALTLVCSGFLVGISILFGYWCFYFPGLLLKINFMVVTPVIVLEDEFYVLSALGRSWDLINGRKWYVFKCLLGLDCLYLIINWLLRALLQEDDNDNHPYFSLTFHILKMIPQTMIVPLFGILKTVIYINLLIEQEGTNQEQFAQQIDQGFLSSSSNMVDGNGSISRVPLLFGEENNNHNNTSNFNFDPNNNNNIGAAAGGGGDGRDVEISFDDPEASTTIPEFQTLHDAFMNVARTRSVSSSTVGCEESTHTSMESFMTAPTGTTAAATTTTSSSQQQQQQQQQENDEV